MVIIKKLQLVKEIIKQLVVYYFKEHDKMIAINLSKPQVLDTDLKAIKNFTGNLG